MGRRTFGAPAHFSQSFALENFSYTFYINRLEKPREVCYNGISF